MMIQIELFHILIFAGSIVFPVLGCTFWLGGKLSNLTSAINHAVNQSQKNEIAITDLYKTKKTASDCEPTHAFFHKANTP